MKALPVVMIVASLGLLAFLLHRPAPRGSDIARTIAVLALAQQAEAVTASTATATTP